MKKWKNLNLGVPYGYGGSGINEAWKEREGHMFSLPT